MGNARECTLSKYLSKCVKYLELKIVDSAKKDYYISQIGEFAHSLGLRKRVVIDIEDLADELIMNALYHAPCDKNGHHKYSNLSRTKRVILERGEEATLECAYDGRFFGVAVTDPFGSLEKEDIIKYLERCVAVKEVEVNEKSGGAGLGFYKIFNVLDQLIINIAPGIKTEVIGIINVTQSIRRPKQDLESSLQISVKIGKDYVNYAYS